MKGPSGRPRVGSGQELCCLSRVPQRPGSPAPVQVPTCVSSAVSMSLSHPASLLSGPYLTQSLYHLAGKGRLWRQEPWNRTFL